MWIITLSQRVEEDLEHVIAFHFTDITEGLIVAADDSFLWRAEFEFIQVLLKKLCLDARFPDFISFREVFWPRGLLAV